MNLSDYIRDVPDFPKPGILFKDICPLLADPAAMSHVEQELERIFSDEAIDVIVGMESRGFLFGVPLARRLGVGFVPIRKAGKLPGRTVSYRYRLEYGEAEQEIQWGSVTEGQRVLIVDDLLATGGTAEASVRLVEQLGAEVVGLAFVVELSFLKGRGKLSGYRVEALIDYSE